MHVPGLRARYAQEQVRHLREFEIWKTENKFASAEFKDNNDIGALLADFEQKMTHPQQSSYDVGVLFTGQICTTIMGMAYTGSMCFFKHAAVIGCSGKQDWHNQLGWTLGHELGHTYGMCHDGDTDDKDKCAIEQACPTSGFVMAAFSSNNPAGLVFSTCSDNRMYTFIEKLYSEKKNCLLDAPV